MHFAKAYGPLLAMVGYFPIASSGVVAQSDAPFLKQTAEKIPSTTETWSQVQRLYEKAKNQSATATQDLYDWTREDLGRIGTWEYQVRSVTMENLGFLEEELNRLGAQRWECFHVEPWARDGKDPRVVLFLKRPARSYLKHLPLPSLWNLFPGRDSEGSAPAPGQD